MEAASTISFLSAARQLSRAARSRRLTVPAFRSPPRLLGADRSLRRSGRSAIVAVRVRGRPMAAVVADMIDGIVAANCLVGVEADRARSALWDAVCISASVPARAESTKAPSAVDARSRDVGGSGPNDANSRDVAA